jgi:TPR repeat protein
MDQGFIDILKQLVKEQGSAALTDAKRCKALLADYTRNEYKKQSRLLVLTVEEGFPKVIEGAEDLTACKKAQIRELEEEHGLNSVFAADMVNLLAMILRGDTTATVSPTVNVPTSSPPAQQKAAPLPPPTDAELYRKAAEQGNAKAQFALGNCYKDGKGVKKDEAKALEWWTKAAEQGLREAQYNVGLCNYNGYFNGSVMYEDVPAAVKWWKKAAAQGDELAQYMLGVCYTSGYIIGKDTRLAREYFRKAAAQGNAKAKKELSKRILFFDLLAERIGGRPYTSPLPYITAIIIGLCFTPGAWALFARALALNNFPAVMLTVLTMALGGFITYKAVDDWYYISGGIVLITPVIALIGIVCFFIVPKPVQAVQPAPLEIEQTATPQTEAQTQTKPQTQQQKQNTEPQTEKQLEVPQIADSSEVIVEWARGNYPASIIVSANSITGHNINITGARTIVQKPLTGHPNLKWAYVYVGDKKYGVVWDRTTYTRSMHDGIELGMGSEARSAFDFYGGSDKDSIFSNIAREAPAIKVVK